MDTTEDLSKKWRQSERESEDAFAAMEAAAKKYEEARLVYLTAKGKAKEAHDSWASSKK